MIIGLNGKCIQEEQAVVSVYDHGFLYGIGLFETFRTYDGVPFLLDEHIERLVGACKELGIQYDPNERQLRNHINELLARNGLKDGYVRLSVSAGVQPLGLPSGDYTTPNVIVYVKALPKLSPSSDQGKALQLLKLRRNTPEGSVRMKSLHYMNNVLAKRELSGYIWAEGAEGLQLDQHNHLAEGIVSNLFFVMDGRICTPSLATGILPGITRAHVMELAKQEGLLVEEGLYTVEQLTSAQEIWMTNSIQEITPIHIVFDTEGNTIWQSSSQSKYESSKETLQSQSLMQSSYNAQLKAAYAQSIHSGNGSTFDRT